MVHIIFICNFCCDDFFSFMKLIAIGDTHGHDEWKAIVEKEKDADKIIFIGDYFDSFDIPAKKQFQNFNELLQLKIDNPEQVVLLLGNHDFHYLTVSGNERYSGFQMEHAIDIQDVLDEAVAQGFMQMAFQHVMFLFTHAGVTREWARNNIPDARTGNLAEMINWTFKNHPDGFKFTPSNPLDNTGESITQPPTWVRPPALLRDPVNYVTQIVGHTRVKHITKKGYKDSVILIDTMDHSQEYLAIVDGEVEVRKI